MELAASMCIYATGSHRFCADSAGTTRVNVTRVCGLMDQDYNIIRPGPSHFDRCISKLKIPTVSNTLECIPQMPRRSI